MVHLFDTYNDPAACCGGYWQQDLAIINELMNLYGVLGNKYLPINDFQSIFSKNQIKALGGSITR